MSYQPVWLLQNFPKVKRVYVGEKCPHQPEYITGQRFQNRTEIAHAHSYYGLICFTLEGAKFWDELYPSPTFLHEYAHLLVPDDLEHSYKWRLTFLLLLRDHGYSLPAGKGKYRKLAHLDGSEFVMLP